MFCPEANHPDYTFDESLTKITEYTLLGKLPNPFLMEDGTIADTPEKWAQRRKEIYKDVIELQYGTMPPEPEFLEVEKLYGGGYNGTGSYRIITGTREKPVTFLMKVIRPKSDTPCPVVIDGDMCFMYHFDPAFYKTFTDNGICFCTFDRTQLAHDVRDEGRRQGQLYETYPDYTFGAVGAWAWGFSRCLDALEKLAIDDLSLVAFAGHSRGAKTAMLAGALDERATIVAPNSTCAGANGCYRIKMKAITEHGQERRSEGLEDMMRVFPFWFGESMADYVGREEELPFDSHYLKAMIAPRILIDTEAASDIWANTVGSYMTTMAAKEVYKLLGVEENLYWAFRKGYHYHKVLDIELLVNVISHLRDGAPICDRFYHIPFEAPELPFDWRCPEKK